MKKVYSVRIGKGDWVADFACLETAQRFVGSDTMLVIYEVFKLVKRDH